ncbi:hypothetical protein RvY_10175 [Ramazzottius varieornatus]|uniref:Ribonuclease P protein subunit p29 n=1 Tax=Ramazzottius varieornatus TaxID=947166 RepID=A0A1D1VBW2_RAMVA|nr:hypothetical protein RvY_10175 [Ramazzottius varieornatus]
MTEEDLYTTIEEAAGRTSQDLSMVGQKAGGQDLKNFIKKAFVTNRNRFEDTYRKNYLSFGAKPKAKKNKKKKSPKGLSRRERKLLKVYDIPKEQQKYSLVESLHELWCGYMEETFRLSTLQPSQVSNTQEDLTKADYHGAMLKVLESPNSTLVGHEGIVVRETKNMFHIINRDDELKILPKSVCVFQCTCRNTKIKIFGNNFCARPADRIKKKLGKRQPIKVL